MTTRRDFLKKAAMATAALGMGNVLDVFSSPSAKVAGANERIRLGVIGVNSRGNALAQGFAKMKKDCEIAYVCDCDLNAMSRCIIDVSKIAGYAPKGEQDIRRLLEH